MTLEQILRIIRGARRVPAERDSLYNVIRYFDETPPQGSSVGSREAVVAA